MLGGVTYRHVKWLRNHEQRQRKVGRPSEGCPCYYVHCLTCKSSLALNGRNQNNMPVSFVCRRTSWLQSCFGMRGEEKQQVNGKRRNIHLRGSWKVTSSESASLSHLLHRLEPQLTWKHGQSQIYKFNCQIIFTCCILEMLYNVRIVRLLQSSTFLKRSSCVLRLKQVQKL